MTFRRWTCLALLLLGLAGCGQGSSDPSKDPTAGPAIQQRTERINRYKAEAAKPARRPGQ